MENRIRIMVVEPLKKPYFASIKNTKNVYEKIVGGEICDDLLDSKTAIVYNKNAKENELVPNRRVGRDIICGTFFVASEFSDNEYASLSDIQSSYYYREFSEAEVMSQAEVKENLEYAINGIGKDYVYTNNLSMRFYEENTDFVKVSESYKTEDKSAAKELLKIMYEEFVKTYDTDCIDDIIGDGEDFIDIPVVFKSKNSDVIRIGIVCVNLEASGEQHGAQFALSGGFYEDLDPRMTEELKAERKELGVYDYWYPFTYAGDIHTDFNDVPEAVQEMIDYAKGMTEQNNTMEMSK